MGLPANAPSKAVNVDVGIHYDEVRGESPKKVSEYSNTEGDDTEEPVAEQVKSSDGESTDAGVEETPVTDEPSDTATH